jgi:hypothetical protein
MTEPTPQDYAAAAAYIERISTPQGAFADLLGNALARRETAAPPDQTAAEPPGPRLPAPNRAQGSSGLYGARPQNPIEEFTDLIQSKIHASKGSKYL